MPSLKVGRRAHGCGSYTQGGRTVLIVFGGGIGNTKTQTDTTEILRVGDTRWQTVQRLPRKLWDVTGINMNNVVWAMGKKTTLL